MIINIRTVEIYNYILKNPGKTLKEVARYMNINNRKIRYEIENLNFLLSMNKINCKILNSAGKISIEKNSETLKFGKILSLLERPSQEQRRDLIIFKYLLDEKTNIKKLSDEFKVSRTTIKKDLKYIEEKLRRTFSEINDEVEIRKILVEISLKYIGNMMLKINNNIVTEFMGKNIFSGNKKYVKIFLEKISEGKLPKSEFYSFFYSYILISIFRIISGKSINMKMLNRDFIKSTKEYEIILKNISLIENSSKIVFNENEKLQLADYLTGFFSYSYNTEMFEKWIEINLIIKSMICKLEKEIKVKFSEDEILLESLLNHIKPAIYRAKNKIYLEESEIYFNESEHLDKNLLKVVEEEVKKIEKLLDIKFKMEEIILFAVHFQASLERISEKHYRGNRKVLLMCTGGYGTTTILMYKLKEKYDLKELKLISYLGLSEINLKEYDAMITTINLKKSIQEKLKIEIIKVSPFLIEEDIKKLDSYFNKKKIKEIGVSEILKSIRGFVEIKNEKALTESLENLLFDKNQLVKTDNSKNDNEGKRKESLYDYLNLHNIRYIENKIESWEEIIDKGVEILKNNGKVSMNYSEDIKSLIKNFGSYMVVTENVAIPHAEINKNVYCKGTALIVLKYPIIFPENKKVKILFFLSSLEKKDNIKIIEDIINLIDKYDFRQKTEKIRDEKSLIRLIDNIRNEVKKDNGRNK
ncbi:PRD domain-containing protein [Leptotrichia sp. OH3620_COT-345]|uniref:BglG family transcription antiterminator n=1 Tax=Leptotrichia sp. OH3620_COT-345 TaxID=2491048 RepID=UPI000F650B82|nr:PTS sugar transporter subunit IIA [Leptotrichia sp. OH3620_COT-345]RRD39214.1 PRD domain-containing protein [Leptotrichia sp. OH3620_COT-345]